MRIKKRLHINVAVSVLTALFICLLLFLALHRLNRANNAERIADDIMTGMFERITLRNDYIRNNSERAKEQWFARHERIGGLLRSAAKEFRAAEDRKVIDDFIEEHESIGRIFAAIVASRENSGWKGGSADLSSDVEDRLLNQLNMKIYEVVIHSRKLLESSGNARASAFRLAGMGVVSVLAILVAAVMINSWTMGRGITARAARLREDAAVIGGGDLEHRIDLKGDDEFAEIGEAFNAMAERLSGSYRRLEGEIEERKQAEAGRQESEERLALAASATRIGMFDWDLARGTVLWTQAHESIFGYAPAVAATTTTTTTTTEHLYGRWADRVHPEDLPLVEEESRRCMRDRKPLEAQYRIIWPDGALRWVETRGVFLYGSDGKADRMLGVVMDITERKRAEEEHHRAAERFRIMGEVLPYGIWWCNEHGGAEYVSRSFLDLLEMSMEEMKEFGWTSRLPPDEVEPMLRRWLHCVETGENWDDEHHVLGPDGKRHSVLTRGRPVRDRNDRIVGWAGINLDIDARKEAEQALQEAYEDMSKLVEERTRELKEKEVLLKEIHHRVKNNLQVISSLVSLQADGSTDKTVRDVLRDVTYRVRSMALVHEKLYQSTDLARIDFAEYIRGLLGYLWRAHGAAAAFVRLNLDLSPVSLPVDTAVPCGLILNELAGNALKHAFLGRTGGEVTVSLKGGEEGRVSFCVADDGVGLPAGLDWREAKSLGLRLVQMLAGQLGGEVKVESSEGTRFEVSFEVSRGGRGGNQD